MRYIIPLPDFNSEYRKWMKYLSMLKRFVPYSEFRKIIDKRKKEMKKLEGLMNEGQQ